MSDKITIVVSLNNKDVRLNVEPRLLLVDLLRYQLELKGTHIGCDTSQCGSCMVMIDGKCVKSCSIFAVQCDKKSIKTIESIINIVVIAKGKTAPNGLKVLAS